MAGGQLMVGEGQAHKHWLLWDEIAGLGYWRSVMRWRHRSCQNRKCADMDIGRGQSLGSEIWMSLGRKVSQVSTEPDNSKSRASVESDESVQDNRRCLNAQANFKLNISVRPTRHCLPNPLKIKFIIVEEFITMQYIIMAADLARSAYCGQLFHICGKY